MENKKESQNKNEEKPKENQKDQSAAVAPYKKIDLNKMRLSQDYASSINVKKTVLTVPVKKPHRQLFVRVHPDESYRLVTNVLEYKGEAENDTYLVDDSLWETLAAELVPKTLFLAITRQGNIFMWPVRMPGEDGRLDTWSRSSMEAASTAMKGWVRVCANKSIGSYELFEPRGSLSEPVWPDKSFDELLQIAFKDRFIETLDHPIVQRIDGFK